MALQDSYGVVTPAAGDFVLIVDISDPTQSDGTGAGRIQGSTKRVTLASLLDAIGAAAVADGISAAERAKLSGIADGATTNATDAALRDRSTHTGTQSAATISDFASAVQTVLTTAGTNLAFDPGSRVLSITTGADVTLPEATALLAGLMSPADKALVSALPAAGSAPVRLEINTQSGAAYTLVAADEGRATRMTSASANTLTVPTNATAPIPIGALILVRQAGAGQTTIAAESGVTLNSASGLRFRAQHSTATLQKVAADEWDVTGDLEV